MALYHRSSEKRRLYHDFRRQEEEVIGSLCRLGNRPVSPKSQLEQEKRIRREIANSNERRRMQSINAGFQSLRTLLPHHEGEKLSKAAILQQTAEFIYQLEQEKTRLLSQNSQLKRLVNAQLGQDSDNSSSDSPLPKKSKIDTEPIDEGIGISSPTRNEPGLEEIRREMIELRLQLDRERRMRMLLEEQTRNLEAQLYPERIREIAHQDAGNESESTSSAPSPPITTTARSISSDLCSNALKTEIALSPPRIQVKEEEQISDKPHDLSTKAPPPPPTHIVPLPQHQTTPQATTFVQSVPQATLSVSVPPPEPPHTEHQPVVAVIPEEVQPSIQPRLYHASTSRQNLETIVEAIRHLEGDHLFRDDPEPITNSEELSNEQSERERTSDVKEQMVSSAAQHVCLAEPDQKRLAVNNGQCVNEYAAIRQQVIQCQMSRPGVIVANHA